MPSGYAHLGADGSAPVEGGVNTPAVYQTVSEALSSTYFKVNIIVCGIFNWGLNLGLAYGTTAKKSQIGLWSEPNVPNSSATAMWVDMVLTCFCIVWLTSAVSAPGVKAAVQKGDVIPVLNHDLNVGIFRYFPVQVTGCCARSILLALQFTVIYAGPSLFFMWFLCQSGAFLGDGAQNCAMGTLGYTWFKAFWAGIAAMVAYPFLMLGSLNRDVIPDEIYAEFLVNYHKKHGENLGAGGLGMDDKSHLIHGLSPASDEP